MMATGDWMKEPKMNEAKNPCIRKTMGIAAFTENGRQLAKKIQKTLCADWEFLMYQENLQEWCRQCFVNADALLFIGACGIAVRTIAPCLKSKTTDPAVLVMDEAGHHVISLLSGHLGGANEWTKELASQMGAAPVITTASDLRGKIAVDVFAKQNGLFISSMTAAKQVEAAILDHKKVGFWCEQELVGTMPEEFQLLKEETQEKYDALIYVSECNVGLERMKRYLRAKEQPLLWLIPGVVTLGIGCRKGKTVEEIRETVWHVMGASGIPKEALCQVASIDVKKEEAGILGFCDEWHLPFRTYSAEELSGLLAEVSASAFVQKTVGVDNVCERAALMAAGERGVLLTKKHVENGVTVAFAAGKWRIQF